MEIEINKILNYINENYEDRAEIKPNIFGDKCNICIYSEKYDLEILLKEPEKNHYLFGKCKYCIDLDYETNKKYGKNNYHGGGGSYEYNSNDYSNIKSFLDDFCKPRKYKQINLFD